MDFGFDNAMLWELYKRVSSSLGELREWGDFGPGFQERSSYRNSYINELAQAHDVFIDFPELCDKLPDDKCDPIIGLKRIRNICHQAIVESRQRTNHKNKPNIKQYNILKKMEDDGIHNDFIFGGIEWPNKPEYEQIKCNSEDTEIKQFVWLVEATTYIALHLRRLIEEEITGLAAEWYNEMRHAFRWRLMPIDGPCANMFDILPARLPAFTTIYKEKYDSMVKVATEADLSNTIDIDNVIQKFKKALYNLEIKVSAIYSEASIQLKKQIGKKIPPKTGEENKTKKRRKRKIKITDKQRDIWERIGRGATVAELASEKGCSETNIRQQYKRAEQKLEKLKAGSRSLNYQETRRIPTDKRGQEIVEDNR